MAKSALAKVKWGDRVSELRVQVDRWPLTDDNPTAYMLTIICAGLYAGRPSAATIRKALQDAMEQIPDA